MTEITMIEMLKIMKYGEILEKNNDTRMMPFYG